MWWLLVALIPGLLMLATVGLERVESSLRRDAISATHVADFLSHAGAGEVDARARGGMNSAPRSVQERLHGLHERDAATDGLLEHVPA